MIRLSVPLLDLGPQYRALRPAIEAAMRGVCDSQRFVLGPQVQRLEEGIAAYCGVEHAVGLSSGTDALLAALMALGIGAGDEVIVPAFTFFATAGAVALAGARPVFCDIEPDTLNLDPQAVRAYLARACRRERDRTVNAASGAAVRAIIPVHLFGRMADMAAFAEIAAEHALVLIEDAAQAIGAEAPDGRRAGSIGRIGCLSFFPTKNLGAFGDAGMCVTRSAELALRLRLLRVHGSGAGGRHHPLVGGNFRLDELQAAVLNVKLEHLDDWTERRRERARRYEQAFTARGVPLHTPGVPGAGRHVFNQYVVQTPERDRLQAHLRARQIGTAIYYPVPLHRQECFAHLHYRAGELPVAEAAARTSLALPLYPELRDEQQHEVVAAIAGFFTGGR
ncbi:MAG TPA: DegT/DnrJ/EryC1/StrS family aminotransferase [Woeseiaceae bacterium]